MFERRGWGSYLFRTESLAHMDVQENRKYPVQEGLCDEFDFDIYAAW